MKIGEKKDFVDDLSNFPLLLSKRIKIMSFLVLCYKNIIVALNIFDRTYARGCSSRRTPAFYDLQSNESQGY
jgi:hypothetical protein